MRCEVCVSLLLAVIITYVNSQVATSNSGNPATGNDITKTNSEKTALTDSSANEPPKRAPPSSAKRPRRRQQKGNMSNANGGDKVTASETPVKAIVDKVKKPAVEETLNADSGAGFAKDPFFYLFGETTTVGPEPDVPPPEFSVNIPAKQKVMPKVDTRNSKAYDGTPCNETYKNHDTEKTKYMMKYADGVWETLDCPPNLGTGLVWRQDLCSCGEELVPQDPDDWCGQMGFNPHPTNQHKYLRKHHGTNAVMDCAASLVWSQTNCLCKFDPTVKERPIENAGEGRAKCKVILRMEFEGNLKNDAEAYHVSTVTRTGKLPRIIFRQVAGSTGRVAMIYSQPLEFLAFSGNDFQTQVTYSLRFKMSPRHMDKDTFMILITDECILNPGGQNRARDPSIKLAFRPNTQTFHLQFKTEKTDVDKFINGSQPDNFGWYKIILYFEDWTLSMKVNGKIVFTQTDVIGKIPANKCPLYIAGSGPGFDRSQDFYGYLDNVFLVKDCPFKTSDVKFL